MENFRELVDELHVLLAWGRRAAPGTFAPIVDAVPEPKGDRIDLGMGANIPREILF
jgi:hypothetical protein